MQKWHIQFGFYSVVVDTLLNIISSCQKGEGINEKLKEVFKDG